MDNRAKIEAIIGKIAEGKHTNADLIQLHELLGASDSESLIQLGKNIVGKIDGREIQIGDRIFQGADAEVIRQELRSVLQELRLVLQEKQKADAEAIREALRLFLEELRSVLQKPIAERPQAEQQLLKRVKARIEERRKECEPINLDKEWQQAQVEHRDRVNISGHQGKIQESPNIFDIFIKAEKQLLILGEPGSGKTTTMLELAKALIDLAKQQNDSPIPVLLKLSSWKKDRITMFAWLVDQIDKEYGCGISKAELKKILIADKLLLMLDGLDELEESSRKNCVEGINNLLKSGEILPKKQKSRWFPDSIVICSRRKEYENLGFKLQLNRAICLQALSDAQIKKYLADRQRENFWQTLQYQEGKELRDVLQRPLFLKIACDAITEISIDELNNLTSLEARQQYLSRAYIRWCLIEEDKDSKIQKIRLLIWLAQQLQNHGQIEFFIERMEPSWLPPGTLKWYVLLVPLSMILIFLLLLIMVIIYIYYMDRNFNILNIIGYSIFIVGSLVTAVSASLDPKIKVFEDNIVNAIFGNHSINLRNFSKPVVFVILFAVVLLIFLTLSTISHSVFQLICIILFCGLLMVGIARLNGHELQQRTLPNQGIWNSAINAACLAIPIAITVATGLSIKFSFKLFILQFLSSLLMIGLPLGLICALLYGGLTCIQHFTLRLILWCNRHPWNYAKFLDNAVKLKLLRRVGGRYEFIHSLLKECFAKLPDITEFIK